VQAILVTGATDTGHIRGLPVGYTDDAAQFTVDQLIPLS